jgi:hypothetical protein
VLVNIRGHGFVADWLLPLVPALCAAMAHQAGVAYERLGHSRTIASTTKKGPPSGMPGRQRAGNKSNVDHIG